MTISSGACAGLVRERERVEKLELVVEVVLEPQHHLNAVSERLEKLSITALERRQERASATPAAAREELGASSQQLRSRPRPAPAPRGVRPARAAPRRRAPVCRSVLPALSPFVTCSSAGRVAGSCPRRAR